MLLFITSSLMLIMNISMKPTKPLGASSCGCFFLYHRAHDRKMKSINAETINSSSTFFVMDISIGRTSLLLASRSTILPLYLPDCDM